MNLGQKQTLYVTAKAAKSGQAVQCPTCAKTFTKSSYQQAFCSNYGPGNCKDAYWSAVRATKPEPTAPVAAERSDEQYAIEHAGYLATAAESYMTAIDAYAEALGAIEESDGGDINGLEEQADALADDMRDARASLKSAVYEFRKRARRAQAGAHGQ